MRNGYFKLVNSMPQGVGVKYYPPEDGGENFPIPELAEYLDEVGIPYDVVTLSNSRKEEGESFCYLGNMPCPVVDEKYVINISPDNMEATVRFYAPSESGKRISFDEFLKDVRKRNIVYGIQMSELQDFFQSPGIYCTDFPLAKGKPPRHGTDAKIEYFFNTDVHAKPTVNEDGSVDYFNLNVINHCRKGDLLAKIIPADEGEYGSNILGARIKPRDVKKAVLKFGNHVEQSEDKMTITSMVDGHVMLVDDKVFVSDVYEVEDVNISTGNIDFNGSVQINGNVASNFVVRANGNVIINGVVEGAHIIANGNVIIARGMNGMSKGILHASGNIVAKFIESATVVAENGYVNTESILHSNVSAGDEIVVEGKRGFVTGGRVQACNRVRVKNLGAVMGAPTVVEVGVSPKLKEEYLKTQKEVADAVKFIKSTQPILENFAAKRAKGVKFNQEQLKYIMDVAKATEIKKRELQVKNEELSNLQQMFETRKKSVVEVTGEVYPGTTVVIGDMSMAVSSSYKYCKFELRDGEVKIAAL